METGGMKGHREELPKARFHRILCEAFGVESIHSEYGMAELTSQAYSSGSGIFRTPGWMRVLVRDVNDPFDIRPAGVRGGPSSRRRTSAASSTTAVSKSKDVSTAATYAVATCWYSKHRGFGIYAKRDSSQKHPEEGGLKIPQSPEDRKKTETDKNPNKI